MTVRSLTEPGTTTDRRGAAAAHRVREPEPAMRRTGIDAVGDAPWGTHFCQFYSTAADLTDILVPYFKAGLEAGEHCMWITSPPLGVADAWSALARAVPDLERHRAEGRIEILPHTEWYLAGGAFDQDRVLAAWIARLDAALARGCAGLRLTGNTFWLEKADWRSFADHEAAIDATLGRYRMLALCTYSVDRCGASEVADVIRNHQFALIKRDGAWELFESADRRRMQDALAAERERLEVTLESIADAVIATDTDARITTLNPAAEALTGWTQVEAVVRPAAEVLRLVSERSGARADDLVRGVLAGGAAAHARDVALVSRDGGRVPVTATASPIRGRGGRSLGAVLVFRDVTAERRAEEALRRSEERVRLELDSILSPEGDIGALELADILDVPALQSLMDDLFKLARLPMAVIDLQGRILVGVGWQDICTRFHRVHPETSKFCVESDTELTAGVPSGECRLYKCKNQMWDIATPLVVGGHHVGNVFMGQFFFDDEQPDRELFAAQARRYGFDVERYLAALDAVPRLTRASVADGMAFFLGLAAMLSRLSYSNVSLARSMAEREALMRSLQESKDRLEEADRRKDEFLAMLSHELRNPLAPIRSSVYILSHADPGGEQARRAKAVIERQAEQLTGIVDDLLDVTRIARGKIELRRERVDLCQLVRRAGDDHAGVMRERGLVLAVEVPRDPCWTDGDPVRLAQLVGNLLHNSAKFTPRGGRVTVTLEASGGDAELHVRDTGEGIDPALLERVFDPFVQEARGTARASSGGLGLGLALVKGLAEKHGGSVRAASAGRGRGADLVVRLPLAAPQQSARARAAHAPGAGRSRRVLVVDDNADGAESLAELVEMFGHVVEVAHDGPSALEKARAHPPDVVLCDIGLPGMSGYEVARALRRSASAAELVAVSGYAQPEDLKKAAEAGFDRHVAKPPDPDELERLLA